MAARLENQRTADWPFRAGFCFANRLQDDDGARAFCNAARCSSRPYGIAQADSGADFAIQLAFATFIFGVVLFEPIRRLVENMDVDATFTGRVSIWKFALEALSKRPWTGYGYESFWSSAYARHAARPYYLDWDVRGIVHGHNSYLDVAMTMGIPALLCAIAVIIVMPLVHYARCRPVRENMLLADFF